MAWRWRVSVCALLAALHCTALHSTALPSTAQYCKYQGAIMQDRRSTANTNKRIPSTQRCQIQPRRCVVQISHAAAAVAGFVSAYAPPCLTDSSRKRKKEEKKEKGVQSISLFTFPSARPPVRTAPPGSQVTSKQIRGRRRKHAQREKEKITTQR